MVVTMKRTGSSDQALTLTSALNVEQCDQLEKMMELDTNATVVFENLQEWGLIMIHSIPRVVRLGSSDIYVVDKETNQYRDVAVVPKIEVDSVDSTNF